MLWIVGMFLFVVPTLGYGWATAAGDRLTRDLFSLAGLSRQPSRTLQGRLIITLARGRRLRVDAVRGRRARRHCCLLAGLSDARLVLAGIQTAIVNCT